MPLYEYQDTKSGRSVELVRPVAQRDVVPEGLIRLTVPTRVCFKCGREFSQAEQVLEGCRKAAANMSTAEFERETGFTANHIKKVWENDHEN